MKNPISMLAWTMIVLALTASRSQAQSVYEPYRFTTLAGNAGHGSADGTGSDARFGFPSGIAVDNAGNVYVADSGNHTIRKVTPAGEVTTLAGLAGSVGSADGAGSAARFAIYSQEGFAVPSGLAVDSTGNVYVADTANHTIRKVTPAGAVTTLAGQAPFVGNLDGIGSTAFFNNPSGVAVDTAGNVYVADQGSHTIRKVTPAGVVTTLAGLADRLGRADGIGSAARFSGPSGVAVDYAGNVYVADTFNNTIRKVTSAGVVTTLAGLAGSDGSVDGTGDAARFSWPLGAAVDSAGNVYVADLLNSTIRKVTPAGVVTTLAGLAGSSGSADGTGSDARFSGSFGGPYGVAVDSAGNVYVADYGNSTIRKVTPAGVVTTLAGLAGGAGSADGTGSAARFSSPSGVAVDTAGGIYVADTSNNTIRKVTAAGKVTTLAGLSGSFFSVAVDNAGNVYVADSGNNTIRKATPAGELTTLAGLAGSAGSVDGTGSAARFNYPTHVAADSAGSIYVADALNNTIRKVTPTGVVTTLAGTAGQFGSNDGTGSAARFDLLSGVAVDSAGNVYVTEQLNATIRKVTPSGVVTTLAGGAYGSADGTGSAAQFASPSGLAVDSAGNVYVADTANQTIRKVTPAGVVTTLAGWAGIFYGGSADGTGNAARFKQPFGVAVDSAGNIYVADRLNNTIRKGSAVPMGFLLFGPRIGFNGGQFGFFLTGLTGQSVVVEASTDLMSWLPVWTNTFAGALNFVDPQSGVYSNRFYRAFIP